MHQKKRGCEQLPWLDWALSLVPPEVLRGQLQILALGSYKEQVDDCGAKPNDAFDQAGYRVAIDNLVENRYW